MNSAAAYVRSPLRDQSVDAETQEQEIQEWCSDQDISDITVFKDIDTTANLGELAGFTTLLEKYHSYDILIVYKLSVFGDDPLVLYRDVGDIVDSNTRIVCIKELFDTASPMGNLQLQRALEKRIQFLR